MPSILGDISAADLKAVVELVVTVSTLDDTIESAHDVSGMRKSLVKCVTQAVTPDNTLKQLREELADAEAAEDSEWIAEVKKEIRNFHKSRRNGSKDKK